MIHRIVTKFKCFQWFGTWIHCNIWYGGRQHFCVSSQPWWTAPIDAVIFLREA